MRILAIIPARGGSKRLPGKNIRPLNGLPLIAWTIQVALESKACVDVIISTDDPKIAEISARYGATVPGLRPPALATDTARSQDVVLHALNNYEAENAPVDGVLLLQPTSPFRPVEVIHQAIESFASCKGMHTVVSLSPANVYPEWCFHIVEGSMEPLLGWGVIAKRSQDLKPSYALNGSLYLIPAAHVRSGKNIICQGTRPIIMEYPESSIDIDTQIDWDVAEMYAARWNEPIRQQPSRLNGKNT
jgi:CMP-N,N'-diacetyllegionaminic acid synthase